MPRSAKLLRGRQLLGKASRDFLEEVVYRNLGASRPGIMVGPRRGFDNAVIEIGNSNVLILTTDPVSMIPSLGPSVSAWLSVHLIASDYATSGLGPEFATFDFNFPPEMATREREEYMKAIGAACLELGVAIVAGHTGSYPGAGLTVVGGGVMLGIGPKKGYVDPSMSRVGDAIVMTKGAAIEAAATLATSFPNHTTRMVGKGTAKKVQSLVRSCSTVRDALTAASLGLGKNGVTSMHDATEGGVLGCLEEMAEASGHSITVEKERIPLSKEVAAVCTAYGVDPLRTLSEGALLITCAGDKTRELVGRLERAGIPAAEIGRVGRGEGVWLSSGGGRLKRVKSKSDAYWDVYERGTKAGLD